MGELHSAECFRRHSFIDLKDAHTQIAAYIDQFNTRRLHSAIYFPTPAEVFAGKMRERLAECQEKLDRALEARRPEHQAA